MSAKNTGIRISPVVAFPFNSAHTLRTQVICIEPDFHMEFIVSVDDNPQKTVVAFATATDLSFVERWRETLGPLPGSLQREAVDLAQLARENYYADSKVGQPYIATSGEVRDHVSRDPQCEVAGLVLLKCDWFAASDVIGVCHFRRTWCNNLVVDYLAKHPLTLGSAPEPHYKIKGIGPALLTFLSRLGIELSSDNLWGEATQTSCGSKKLSRWIRSRTYSGSRETLLRGALSSSWIGTPRET